MQCKVTCFIIAVDCSDFGYVCFALFENVVEGFSLIVCMKEIVESASTEMMDSIMLKYRLISPSSPLRPWLSAPFPQLGVAMRNKRFSWKRAFVSLAISLVVCLPHRRCHGNRNETGASRIVPELSPRRDIRIDRPRSSHRIHEHAGSLSSSRTGDRVRNRSQYPALMAVMVSSPRLVYPSVVKISDM